MAYLSSDDQDEQKQQSHGQNVDPGFSLYSTPGSLSNKSDNAASSPDSSQQSPSGASSSAADQSQRNYTQTFSGDSSSPSAPSSQGMGDSTKAASGAAGGGTGFINFEDYRAANPSMAGAIAQGGKDVIGAETSKWDAAIKPSQDASYSPGAHSLSDIDSMLGAGWSGPQFATAAEPDSGTIFRQKTPNLNVKYSDTFDPTAIQAWMHPTAPQVAIDYTPTSDYATKAAELGQTSLSGLGNASVLDYLGAKNTNYTTGARALDGALLAGDAPARAAIKQNADDAAALAARTGIGSGAVGSDVAAMAAKNAAFQNLAAQSGADVTGKLGTLGQNQLDAAHQAAVSFENAEHAKKVAEAQAYLDWMNSNAYVTDRSSNNFTVTNTPGGVATDANMMTPQEKQYLNRIAAVQGQQAPYPDINEITAPTASKYDYSVGKGLSDQGNEYGSASADEGYLLKPQSAWTSADWEAAGQDVSAEIARLQAKNPVKRAGDRDGGAPLPSDDYEALQGDIANENTINSHIRNSDMSAEAFGRSLGLTDSDLRNLGIIH